MCVGLLWKPEGVVARAKAPNRQAQEPSAKKVTAGDAYMNIQVLKDIPSDQLLPSMRYITVALGVECSFCHDPKSYESDDKPEKATARKMMTMMFALNKDNFNGRREVTCYTCHHGASHASNIPALTAASATGGAVDATAEGTGAQPGPPLSTTAAPGAASGMPTVDEIIAKYTEALGGAAAIEKITTFDKKGTVEVPAQKLKASAEALRKAPNKDVLLVHLPNATEFAQGYNGTAGWQQDPGKSAEDSTGDDLVRAKEAAAFIPGVDLKQNFARVQVAGTDKIGDRDAYRVVAMRAGGGGQVRFYFDTQSGLLLRISQRIDSPLGSLPENTDYSDYREVNGVKVPFTLSEVQVQGPITFKWEQIQANVPIDDTRFNKPVAKDSQ